MKSVLLLAVLLALSTGVPPGTVHGAHPAPEPRPANWAQPLDRHLNLYRMAPDLYRSALPQAADWPGLARLGVVTVINFYQREDSDWLHDPRVRQVHQPLHADRIDDTDAIAALRSIREAQQRGPVLIHCKHGQNRTGLIAALYRVVYQGWSKQQALAEMRGGGFGGESRMAAAERYLWDVDIRSLRSALASGACSTRAWAPCALGETLHHWLTEA